MRVEMKHIFLGMAAVLAGGLLSALLALRARTVDSAEGRVWAMAAATADEDAMPASLSEYVWWTAAGAPTLAQGPPPWQWIDNALGAALFLGLFSALIKFFK